MRCKRGKVTEISELPGPERAKRYREIAAEAERIGLVKDDAISRYYLNIAEHWRRLADEIEAQFQPP